MPRPKGWERAVLLEIDAVKKGAPVTEDDILIYGAGADAYEKGLKKDKPIMTPEQMKLIAPDRQYGYGYLVFLPEEGNDNSPPRT